MISGNSLPEAFSLPFVSVVVPVYNDSRGLERCLRSLSRQTYPANRYEIVVVDNASSENIRPIVENLKNIAYAYEGKRGPAAARNKGVTATKGEIIAFTDSDCMPASGWLENGVRTLMSTPRCGIVGGNIKLCFRDGDRPTAVEINDMLHLQQKSYVEDKHFAATANAFTFRKVMEEAGSFNEIFDVAAWEDMEWGERVFLKGYQVVYAEDAVVFHPARRTLAELCRKTVRLEVGEYQYNILRKGKGRFLIPFFKDVSRLLRPPTFRYWLRAWGAQESLRSLRRKMEVCFILACVYYVGAATQLRLRWTDGRWRPAR